MKNVLLVPGLHPRGGEVIQRVAYNSCVSEWREDGYNVAVRQFGFDDRQSLASRQQTLLETIDDMPSDLYVIAASAGALAVLGAFKERPDRFGKVITVASPLLLNKSDLANFKGNPLVPIPRSLETMYHEVDEFLKAASVSALAKIISMHGRKDSRVPPHWSQRPGIETYELPVSGHGRTIMSAIRRYRQVTQDLIQK